MPKYTGYLIQDKKKYVLMHWVPYLLLTGWPTSIYSEKERKLSCQTKQKTKGKPYHPQVLIAVKEILKCDKPCHLGYGMSSQCDILSIIVW